MGNNLLWKISAIISVLFLMTSCAQFRHVSGVSKPVNLVKAQGGDDKVTALILEAENRYLGITVSGGTIQAGKTKEVYREIYATKMLELINNNYAHFRKDLVSIRKGFDATSDVIAVSLDTASVLAGAESTKSLLAALSGLTTASKTSVNKTYFYEQALPGLLSQMEAGRASVLPSIYTGLRANADTYPLFRLREDLARYAYAGTVDGALTATVELATIKQKNARDEIKADLDKSLADSNKRKLTAQEIVKTQKGFDELKNAILLWWAALSKDDRGNQLYPLYLNLESQGIPTATMMFYKPPAPGAASPIGTIKPDEFVPFVKSQAFSSTNVQSSQVLVSIAMNAHDLTMPERD